MKALYRFLSAVNEMILWLYLSFLVGAEVSVMQDIYAAQHIRILFHILILTLREAKKRILKYALSNLFSLSRRKL